MKNNMEKKILLSKTLEDIEVNRDSSKVISMLDKYHANARSHVLGITGPPGAGKSSLIDKLIYKIRQKKKTVGVIAIDPSSSRTGGALLGDRTRFLLDPTDDGVFVRSMAAKDFLGGLSELTFPTMVVMRSMFDFIIVETVGVGQSETNVKDVVDSVVLCVQPGSGDTIQFMKSGIFEIPDIIVITKSDIENLSNLTMSELNNSKNFFKSVNDWDIGVLKTSATKNYGFDRLYDEVCKRWVYLNSKNELVNQRISQDKSWIKKSILREYGINGIERLKDNISYNKNPFLTLKNIRKTF